MRVFFSTRQAQMAILDTVGKEHVGRKVLHLISTSIITLCIATIFMLHVLRGFFLLLHKSRQG